VSTGPFAASTIKSQSIFSAFCFVICNSNALGMIMLHLALVTRENMQSGLFKILKELVLASETIPIVLIMSILGWLISMNTLYWDRFNNPELLPDSFTINIIYENGSLWKKLADTVILSFDSSNVL